MEGKLAFEFYSADSSTNLAFLKSKQTIKQATVLSVFLELVTPLWRISSWENFKRRKNFKRTL